VARSRSFGQIAQVLEDRDGFVVRFGFLGRDQCVNLIPQIGLFSFERFGNMWSAGTPTLLWVATPTADSSVSLSADGSVSSPMIALKTTGLNHSGWVYFNMIPWIFFVGRASNRDRGCDSLSESSLFSVD
jgi:hypothetical protein